MIIDNKQFVAGQPLRPNTLWVVEQIPGYTVSADVTNILQKQGYWGSYNIVCISH